MFVVDSGAFNAHAQQEWFKIRWNGYFAEIQNPTTVVTANGEVQTNEEAQVYVHDFDLFVTVQLLDETPAVLLLHILCSKHGYSFEWKNRETPRLAKNWKSIACTVDYFVHLVEPGLSLSSCSSSASTSRPKDQSTSSAESETSSDPVTSRSDKRACGKPTQTDPDKLASGNRGPANTERRDERRGSNERHPWLVTALHRKSRGPGDACAHTLLWKRELRFGKWCLKSRDTKTAAQYLYSLTQETEIAKYASEPRRRTCEAVPRAEKSVTWQKQITKFFLKVVNLETITDMQSWYTILPLNGYNLTRAKQKLLRRRKIVHENFWSRHRNQKLFIRTIQWYWANLVKNCQGIIERPLFIAQKQKELQNELHDESKKAHQQYCYSQDWMKSGGRILWNAFAICEMSKISWQTGKRHMKDDLENHSKGT